MPNQSEIDMQPLADEPKSPNSEAQGTPAKKGKRGYSLKELEQRLERNRLDMAELKAQVEAKRAEVEAQKNKAARELETRMKVLLGAYVMHQMKSDPALKKSTYAQMRKFLTRASERKLFEDKD